MGKALDRKRGGLEKGRGERRTNKKRKKGDKGEATGNKKWKEQARRGAVDRKEKKVSGSRERQRLREEKK